MRKVVGVQILLEVKDTSRRGGGGGGGFNVRGAPSNYVVSKFVASVSPWNLAWHGPGPRRHRPHSERGRPP